MMHHMVDSSWHQGVATHQIIKRTGLNKAWMTMYMILTSHVVHYLLQSMSVVSLEHVHVWRYFCMCTLL